MTRPFIASSECGKREVPDAAARERGAAGEDRLVERPADVGREVRLTRAADIAEEPLQDAEVGVAGRVQRNLPVREPDRAVHIQARVLSHEPHLLDLHRLIVQEQANGAVVAQRVVEQSQVDPIDGAVDQQVLHTAQVADNADRSR